MKTDTKAEFTIKIGGHIIDVQFVERFPSAYDHAGVVYHIEDRILLSLRTETGRLRTNADARQTFLHEVLHYVSNKYLPKDAQLGEHVIDVIAEGLMQLWSDGAFERFDEVRRYACKEAQ